jgi:7-cyano-7-deazaguanine synthase
MDSSLCLLLARNQFGSDRVVSIGFGYQQRHAAELMAAAEIAQHYGIRREVIQMPPVPGWEDSALVTHSMPIVSGNTVPNSFVPGRNGLFLMMASIRARVLGAHALFIGVMEREGTNSGYPDCSRAYIDAVQTVIRYDLQDPHFSIQTPLVHMTKAQTMELADSLGELDFLLSHTITCYEGIPGRGCRSCPACRLRNEGIDEFFRTHPEKVRQ